MDQSKPTTITICKNSHSISKQKARVVHIYEPGIIMTDPADFRELVQRLTGKPAAKTHDGGDEEKKKKMMMKKMAGETKIVTRGLQWRNMEKLEREIEEERKSWRENSYSGFFSDFVDLDLFFDGFCDFPLFPDV